MSTFARRARRYAAEFELGGRDLLALCVSYPAFRLVYEANHGGRTRQRVARILLAAVRAVSVGQTIHGPGGPVPFRLMWTDSDVASFSEIFLEGAYATSLDAASTYVDAGANSGMAAAYFAARYRLGKMLLIEANPDLIGGLARLAQQLTPETRIECVAIADHDGSVEFAIDENTRHSRIGPGRTTPARTLRSLLDQHGLDAVDILKLDIEGAEHQAIAGDPAVLDRVRCLLMELHGSRAERDATIELVRRQGLVEVWLHRGQVVDALCAVRSTTSRTG